MSQPLIEFRNVYLQFYESPIIQDFNLKIFPNEKVVLFGKSGLGKTSLFRLILGFLHPTKGHVLFNDEKIFDKKLPKIRNKIAYLPQNLNIGQETVKKIISTIFNFHGNQQKQPPPDEIFTYFNKYDLPKKHFHESFEKLSGGEKQRVLLIIALLLDKPILLLDEPTASLDEDLKHLVVKEVQDQKKSTVLVISHDKVWRQGKQFRVVDLNHGGKIHE